jgi:uncharacterized protein (TIGR02246 family)
MSERSEIEACEKAWLAAFNSGDAAGVAKLYAEDARLLPPNTDIIEGRPAIEGFIGGFVTTKAQLQFHMVTLHESPALCASVGTYDLTFPGDIPDDRGKYIEVWAKQTDGSWLMVADTFNSSLPAPT